MGRVPIFRKLAGSVTFGLSGGFFRQGQNFGLLGRKGEGEMTNSRVDPVYKYVDGKIKLIKRELQQLKVAHDAVANQHAQALLELQRIVAALKVNSDVDMFTSVIDSQLHNKSTMRTQVITEAAAIKSQILASNKPNALAIGFYQKWEKAFRDLGADFITY